MANLTTSNPTIASRGHVYYGDPDAVPFKLDGYAFNPSTPQDNFTWMGDSSAENMVEFEVDGGDVNYKSTWDRPNVRAIRENETIGATINSVNTSSDVFNIAFGGHVYDAATKSYKVGMATTATSRSIFIVMEDEANVSALYFPNVELKGTLPTFSNEDFTEIPIKLSVLGSNTISAGASGQLAYQWFEPRPKVALGG